MKLSQKRREALYTAIRESVVEARLKLKLDPARDYLVAQIENAIWSRVKLELGVDD